MICPNCQQPTSRLRFYKGRAICAREMGLSEAGGVKVDGVLTRNADRIREQQMKYEGDLIMPHMFDHNKRELVPNPDFIKRYPERITDTYSQDELEAAGHSQIGKLFDKAKEDSAAHQHDLDTTYRDSPSDGQPLDDLGRAIGEAA